MGSVISSAANGLGNVVGDAVVAPFKSIFGGSCEDFCSGPLDLVCFIEHLCVSNLVKLFMILVLCYITLLFFYLLFKLGLCQCITKSLCKMCWGACCAYWSVFGDITCFLWHKLTNTKRVYRRRCRFQDVELGYGSSDESGFSDNHHHFQRKRRPDLERRSRLQNSSYPSIEYRNGSLHCSHHRHHARLKKRENSVRINGGSQRLRRQRRLRISRSIRRHRNARIFKRRRLR